MCAPCFKFVLYAINIIKVHLKGTSSSLLKGNIRQMKNTHRCKAYQKGNTCRNKNALTAAFTLASLEITSRNEEAINSTRNGIYSLKDFYFLLYRRRYLYLFLNWFSARVKYVCGRRLYACINTRQPVGCLQAWPRIWTRTTENKCSGTRTHYDHDGKNDQNDHDWGTIFAS